MKTKLCIIPFIVLLLAGLNAGAQNGVFSGIVIDNEGEPVIGAGIVCNEKNSAGTTTDIDGRFSMTLPQGAKTFTISSIGFATLTYVLNPQSTTGVKIVLETEANVLDQVVVTGYAQTTV